MSHPTIELQSRLQRLERQVGWHRRAALAAVVLAGAFLLTGFQSAPRHERFAEIDVERLNVVEPDGALALVLGNTARLPDPLIDGETVETGRTGPGMIFFNGKGWEVGGLVYGTRETEDGYEASGHLSFDQYHNDQVVYLNYRDDGTSKAAGLYVVDRAREPTIDELLALVEEMEEAAPEEREALQERIRGTAAQRVFIGSADETAMVRLRDRAGRDRIRLSVDADGTATLVFLDENGDVVQSFPE